MGLTSDPNDPGLSKHNADGMQENHIILNAKERALEWKRPLRDVYEHVRCGTQTRIALAIAETYARSPKFYSSTWCSCCKNYYTLDEFYWAGTTEKVGS